MLEQYWIDPSPLDSDLSRSLGHRHQEDALDRPVRVLLPVSTPMQPLANDRYRDADYFWVLEIS
jgi:hypothetical protein